MKGALSAQGRPFAPRSIALSGQSRYKAPRLLRPAGADPLRIGKPTPKPHH